MSLSGFVESHGSRRTSGEDEAVEKREKGEAGKTEKVGSLDAFASPNASAAMPPPPFTPRRQSRRAAPSAQREEGEREEPRRDRKRGEEEKESRGEADERGHDKRRRKREDDSGSPTLCGGTGEETRESEGQSGGQGREETGEGEKDERDTKDAREHDSVVPRRGKHIHQLRAAEQTQQDVALDENLPQAAEDEALRIAACMGKVEEKQTVWISNLDESVTEHDLLLHFQACPGFTGVRLVLDFRRRSKGFAYADFDSPSAAAAAAACMHGVKIHERPMKVLVSQPTRSVYEEKTLFISQVAEHLGEEDVRRELGNLGFANIGGVRLIRAGAPAQGEKRDETGTGKHKGYGYIDFPSQEAAVEALHFFLHQRRDAKGEETPEKFLLGGEPFRLAPSIPMKKHRWILAPPNKETVKREQEVRKEAPVDATTIFVKNLAFSVVEEDLANHFATLCNVTPSQTVVCRDVNGKSRGFAFLKFDSEGDAMAAMLANDSTLNGRPMTVSRSTRSITTPKNPARPRGAGRSQPLGERQRPGLGFDSRRGHQKPRLALGDTGRRGLEEREKQAASSSLSCSAGRGGEDREKENEGKEAEMHEEKEPMKEEKEPMKEEKEPVKEETGGKTEGDKTKTNAYFRQLFLSGGL